MKKLMNFSRLAGLIILTLTTTSNFGFAEDTVPPQQPPAEYSIAPTISADGQQVASAGGIIQADGTIQVVNQTPPTQAEMDTPLQPATPAPGPSPSPSTSPGYYAPPVVVDSNGLPTANAGGTIQPDGTVWYPNIQVTSAPPDVTTVTQLISGYVKTTTKFYPSGKIRERFTEKSDNMLGLITSFTVEFFFDNANNQLQRLREMHYTYTSQGHQIITYNKDEEYDELGKKHGHWIETFYQLVNGSQQILKETESKWDHGTLLS